MFRIFAESKNRFLFCLAVLLWSFCRAGEQRCCATAGQLDRTRYIGIDEIRPGMEAYCLTAYKGDEAEKFGLEVVSVVRNVMPGRDAILVAGTDERFVHTGPVAGCSGSPVYIDGRLAGALAFGWMFSKDPLYGVTPIEEMLNVGQAVSDGDRKPLGQGGGFIFDFSSPIDFAEIEKQVTTPRFSNQQGFGGAAALSCPLITSGLPPSVCEQLGAMFAPFGFLAVSGIGGGGSPQTTDHEGRDAKLVPGACVVVPLVSGDIVMEVVGTVTEVVGDQVYCFGHSFLGYGPVSLPMATGRVHTVVSSMVRSFKVASSVDTVGALTVDESAGVVGKVGARARMIPLTVKVARYNDTEVRVYNCEVVDNRLITPMVIGPAAAGAAFYLGDFPPDNMVEYKVTIRLEGAEPIISGNVSTGVGLNDMMMESIASVAVVMNNPYKELKIKSIDFDIHILAKNISSHIWSVDLSDSKVKAGQAIEVDVVVESPLAEKKKVRLRVGIPQGLAAGRYDLIVCGGNEYQEFLKQAAPYRFVPQNLGTLIEAVNGLLAVRRDRLYCVLVLPGGGVAVERAELPDLPATKALVLQDEKRALRIQPYPHWIEQSVEIGAVVVDKKVAHITVEK